MVKSSSNSLKAKDIDNQRLQKRVTRLEKMVEINKNYDGGPTRGQFDVIPEERDDFADTD